MCKVQIVGFIQRCLVYGWQSALHGLSPAEVCPRVPAAGIAAVRQVLPQRCLCRPSCRQVFLSWFKLTFPNLDYHIGILEPPVSPYPGSN